jgi:hypothetical protein
VTYSIVLSSSDQSVNIWDESLLFYVGVALPCVLGLTIATCMATYFRLEKPERVYVVVVWNELYAILVHESHRLFFVSG